MKKKMMLFAIILLLALSGNSEAQDNSSPMKTSGPENGHLIIAGGALRDTSVFTFFVRLSGGPDAPIVIIPTASADEYLLQDNAMIQIEERARRMGMNNITILHTRNREEANSREFVTPIMEAKGVWFLGGRQWRIADSYLGTLTEAELFNLLERGGVIGGSSAGATIQGSFLARGDSRGNTIMVGDHLEGFGFVKNIAIDQHLLARNRSFDMFEILEQYPELLGIGLDENTAIHVQGNKFEVVGESYVVIYDGTRWSAERDTVYNLSEGSKEYYLLREGQQYDMLNRVVISD